jgi:AraC family transcriptional regulator of adaptative response / DNA-3-methyladenine glycosylase II
MVKGAEWIHEGVYYRTVRLGKQRGWIAVRHVPEKRALMVEFTHTLTPVLPALLGRLRHLFDLSARPDLIAAQLSRDKLLKTAVTKNPGLRVPGAFDGFELAVRAILGQQVTVKAATTLACRFVEAFGEKIETPFPELHRLAPLPEKIARASVDAIAKLGIISARAKSIIALAKGVASGDLQLDAGAPSNHVMQKLVTIPGIGQWTAHYIAMRALRWPDAFPKEDIAVRNALGGVTPKQAEVLSQGWSPWRSYAVLHLWRNAPAPTPAPRKPASKSP